MNDQKRNMTCNIPRKSWKIGKKRVVKACSGGKQKIIHYGATGYGHNYSALARKSFRARHKCSSAKDKLTARYWACKNLWTKGGSVQNCPISRKCKGKKPSRSTHRKPSRSTRRKPSRSTLRKPSRSTLRKPSRSTRRKPSRSTRRKPSRSIRRKPSRSTLRKPSRSTRRKPSFIEKFINFNT